MTNPTDAGRVPLLLLVVLAILPAVYAPGFFDAETPRFALLLVLALVLVVAWRGRNFPIARGAAAVLGLGLAFVGAAVILAFVSRNGTGIPPWTLVGFVRRTVPPLAVFAATAGLVSSRGRPSLLLALALAPAIVLLLGIVHHGIAPLPGLARVQGAGFTSTLRNTNRVGEVALLGLAPSIALLYDDRRRRAFLGAALVLAAGALLALSRARASMAGAAVVLVAFPILAKGLPPRRVLLPLLLLGLVALGAALAIAPLRTRIAQNARHAASILDPANPSRRVRASLARTSFSMLSARPLTGFGAGAFEEAAPPFREPEEWSLHGLRSLPENAHSEPLNLAAETGVPGLALGAAALLVVGAAGARTLRRAGRGTRPLVVASLAALAGVLVTSFFSFPFHDPPPLLAVAALSGTLFLEDRKPRPGLGSLTIAAVLAAAVPLLLDLGLDLRMGGVVSAYNRAGALLEAGEKDAALERLAGLEPALANVQKEPLKNAARSYRAAQYLSEIGKLRRFPEAESIAPEPATVVEAYRRVLALAPHHLPAILDLADAELAAGLNAEAVQRLLEAHRAMPRAPGIAGRIGWIYRSKGRDADAVPYLRSAVDLYPDLPESEAARRRLVLALVDSGRIAEAGDEVEREIARLGDTPGRRLLGGQVALARGEDARTMGRIPAAPLEREADDAPSRADADPKDGVRAAADGLIRRLYRKPDDVATLEALPDALWELISRSRKSGEPPDEAFFADERNRARAIARVRVLYAADFLAKGDLASAESRLKEALRYDARQGDAYFLRIRTLAAAGRDEEALEVLKAWRANGFADVSILEREPGARRLLERGNGSAPPR